MTAQSQDAAEQAQSNLPQYQQRATGAPTIVQGSVVQGGIAPPGAPIGVQQGQPVPGVQQAQYVQGQQMPQGATPGVVGMPFGVAGGDMPYAVQVIELDQDEVTVLNYRMSLKCFTCIDSFSTMMNAMSAVRDLFEDGGDQQEDDSLGLLQDPLAIKLLSLLSILLIAGPICGYIGAARLNRNLIMVYLAFCFIKTFYEVILAIMTPYLWYILVTIIQIWVTKIVYSFWSALSRLSPDRLQQLLDPMALPGYAPRAMYW